LAKEGSWPYLCLVIPIPLTLRTQS